MTSWARDKAEEAEHAARERARQEEERKKAAEQLLKNIRVIWYIEVNHWSCYSLMSISYLFWEIGRN
jgi:hypothetical protein